MRGLVVLAEEVGTEVAVEVAPEAVDVVGFVLGVVVFEDERAALHAVVVRLAALEAAGPREVQFLQSGLFDFCPLLRGDVGAVAEEVFPDQLHEQGGLLGRQFALRESFRFGGVAARHVEDVLGRCGENHRRLALLLGQRLDQRAAQFLLGGEHARAGAWAGADLAGVRAEKGRRQCRRGVTGGGEIQREMMPLHAPAPRFFAAGRAEDGHEIQLRVAHRPAGPPFLQLREHRLQTHDRNRLGVAAMAQPGGQQRVREQALLVRHFLDHQSLSFPRDEMPVRALRPGERKGRLRLLFRGQCAEEVLCGVGHLGGGVVRVQRREEERKGERKSEWSFHGRPRKTRNAAKGKGLWRWMDALRRREDYGSVTFTGSTCQSKKSVIRTSPCAGVFGRLPSQAGVALVTRATFF